LQFISSVIDYEWKIKQTRQRISENDKVAQAIVDCALDFYAVDYSELTAYVRETEATGVPADRVSVSQALKHFVRDWAIDGEHERTPLFPPILKALGERFPNSTRESVRVLVPGSGLGRLAHEIAALDGECCPMVYLFQSRSQTSLTPCPWLQGSK
jgi:carnosine N-methyltransferase